MPFTTLHLNLAHSQIWLNLPHDDHQFFLHLSMDGCHCGSKRKFIKKKKKKTLPSALETDF
jgi:hypothetical protein